MTTTFNHIAVLCDDVVECFKQTPQRRYIDGTVGGAGHASAVMEMSPAQTELLCIDLDPDALDAAKQRLTPYGARVVFRHGNFSQMSEFAAERGWEWVDGILLDLGVSSYQLDTAHRGFSFQHDADLDMRLDPTNEYTAAELVNSSSEKELADIIYRFGEERMSRKIARTIVEARAKKRIERTSELANLVVTVLGGRHSKLHPATRTFQALRIAVNQELHMLESTIPVALNLLSQGGRLAIISFHSLEDRIVKHAFRAVCRMEGSRFREVTRKPITASLAENRLNKRSRSAKLRIVERC